MAGKNRFFVRIQVVNLYLFHVSSVFSHLFPLLPFHFARENGSDGAKASQHSFSIVPVQQCRDRLVLLEPLAV
jgi:hypothetical protein